MAMLEARDLWVTPPGAREPVVCGLSVGIERGEWVALAGPNGGGKTSLLLALAGLWPATRGEVLFDGVSLGVSPRARRAAQPAAARERPTRGIAAVLQDPSSQLLNATVAEEIAFAATNLGADPAAVERATACWSRALGLEADLGRDPRTLSAGRQQMVLLAAALAASPRLLCADEATAHLDREARSRVRSVIAGEVGRGLTVIWATQDAEELAVAGRVLPVGPTVSGPPATVSPAGGRRSGAEGAFATVQISTDGPVTGPRVMASRPIEFVVPKCGVTALLGPNASGKSLVLAALAGLEAPGQVTIRWEGPTEPPPIIALQYPELQVFEESVGDELVFAAVSRGVPRAKALDQARQALRNLEIESEAMVRRRTWTLSTGEKRLIEVVGALIAPACLVLLDEPTAGLDAKRREALSRLTARRAEGVPVVVATQDHEWVETLEAQIQRLGA